MDATPYSNLIRACADNELLSSCVPFSENSFDSTLRERLRTHKVFTKDQSFYLNYRKFFIKSYVLDVY